jgi:glycerol-3-phosphate dehydrogenase (NAD(P)+)
LANGTEVAYGRAVQIAILGAGALGTSLALTFSRNGHATTLWTRSTTAATEIKRRRENTRRLPGLRLPPSITVTGSLDLALRGAEALVLALPLPALLTVMQEARLRIPRGVRILCASRGLSSRGPLTPLANLRALLPQVSSGDLAVLAGPLLSGDLARDRPACAVLAGESSETVRGMVQALGRPNLEIGESTDAAGVELGAAYKSVVAVAAGVAEALGFGEASRGLLVMRGYGELVRLAAALGAMGPILPETLAGPAGLGDLVLGCTSPRARDWQLGYMLGRGVSLEKLQAEHPDATAEIAETIRAATALVRHLGLDLRVPEAAAAVLSGRRAGQDAVLKLIAPHARRASLSRPSETNFLEMDEVDEGGKTLADGTEIQGAKAVEAEIFDTIRGEHGTEDHGGANVRRRGGPAVGQPTHESTGKGVTGAGWVDDGLDRESRGGEDAALMEEQGASVATLDHDGARPKGPDHPGRGGQVRKP